MNKNNGFDLLIGFVFAMTQQLGGIGAKDQYLVIPFCLCEGEIFPRFHLRALHVRSEIFLLQYKTGQINNLTDKYIMELSKLKHIQHYMTNFELEYRYFKRLPQRH